MSKPKPPKTKPLPVHLRRWHRFIGLVSAVLMVVVAVTGIMLNHTESLGMDQRRVGSPALLNWYGLEAPSQSAAFKAGPSGAPRWFIQSGDSLLLDGEHIMQLSGEAIVGCVFFDDLYVVATDRRLHLFTQEGELVESLGTEAGVPPVPAAVGIAGPDLVVRTSIEVEAAVGATNDLSTWSYRSTAPPVWSKSEPIPQHIRDTVDATMLGAELTLERVVLDLHSGRLFGSYGHLVMDAAAIAMLLLTISGVWLYYAKPKKKKT